MCFSVRYSDNCVSSSLLMKNDFKSVVNIPKAQANASVQTLYCTQQVVCVCVCVCVCVYTLDLWLTYTHVDTLIITRNFSQT